MSGKSQPTMGDWQYRPSQSRAIVSDTGETVAKIHRGKKAQHNGPIVAAAKDAVIATALLLNDVRRLRQGQPVPNIVDHINRAEAAIVKAKGETE